MKSYLKTLLKNKSENELLMNSYNNQTQKKIWISYFVLKVLYFLIATTIVSKFLVLGDSLRYLSSATKVSVDMLYYSTPLMDFIGSILGRVPFIGHTFASMISTYGIWYALRKLRLSNFELLLILVFLSFPTFSIWTSIFGKEAFAVFYLGVIFGYLIGFFESNRIKPNKIEVLAFYLLLVFKPHYSIAIIQTIAFFYFWKRYKSLDLRVAFIFSIFLFNSLILFIFRDVIDEFSFKIINHFSLDAASTRDASYIWSQKYDVFRNMYEGMLIAFVGPTFSEAMNKPIQLLAFIESMVIVTALLSLIITSLMKDLYRLKFNLLTSCVVFNFLFWFLFVHYPFGALNPGSALRYRSGFLHIILFMVFYFCYYRYKKISTIR